MSERMMEVRRVAGRLTEAGLAAWRLGGEKAYLALIHAEGVTFPCVACHEAGGKRYVTKGYTYRTPQGFVVCRVCKGQKVITPDVAKHRLNAFAAAEAYAAGIQSGKVKARR